MVYTVLGTNNYYETDTILHTPTQSYTHRHNSIHTDTMIYTLCYALCYALYAVHYTMHCAHYKALPGEDGKATVFGNLVCEHLEI